MKIKLNPEEARESMTAIGNVITNLEGAIGICLILANNILTDDGELRYIRQISDSLTKNKKALQEYGEIHTRQLRQLDVYIEEMNLATGSIY